MASSMTLRIRSWASGLLFVYMASCQKRAAQFTPFDYRYVTGCYELSVGQWSESLSPNDSAHALPAIVRLDTTAQTRGGKVLTPDIQSLTGDRFGEWPRWDIVGDTVRLAWSNGFTPTIVRLRTKNGRLEGWAEARTDIVIPEDMWPRAHVVARRVECTI